MKLVLLVLSIPILAASGIAQHIPAGTVEGRLTTADGRPAVGIRVALAELDANIPTGVMVRASRTDDTGKFHLQDVPPGHYWIAAGSLAEPTYFPGTTDKRNARNVTVADGSIIRDLDFVLVTSANDSIFLPVTSNSRPFDRPPIHVRFILEDGETLPSEFGNLHIEYGGIGSTPSAALFDLPLSPSVEYVAVSTYGSKLFGNYYIKSMSYGSIDLLMEPLAVTSAKFDDIKITLAAGSRVSGNVTTENGSPPNITVYLIPNAPNNDRSDMLRLSTTDSKGNFEFFGVAPGEYSLSSANDLDPLRESTRIQVSGDTSNIQMLFGANRGLHRIP
jgi:carboxypeptidase family protein